MGAFQISLRDKIELRPLLSDGSCAAVPFPSQIQDIVSESEFLIFPLNDDWDGWMGRIFQLEVIRENGIYTATVKIVRKSNENNLHFFHLVLLKNFKRLQRRSFFRLKINLATEIAGYGTFRTIDISGGGMTFVSDKKIDAKETITGTIDLRGEVVSISGIVVRCINDSGGSYFVCVEFTDIRKPLQDEIVAFIHKEQLIMIKKGILMPS